MKRRKDSYFGLHFDFHASPEKCNTPIGATLSEDEIREICTLLRPDFIQIDCKGHDGWASYPSEIGNAMPEFRDDPLEKWRRITKEEDVALYLHYSGVWDFKYCEENPDKSILGADGKRSTRSTRTAGEYADEILIPQIRELIEKYDINGMWIDGDCWGTDLDYDERTLALFKEKTGIDISNNPPKSKNDKYYHEFREFCRELFRSYVRHYVDAAHKINPDFQIASNWAYTDHCPEAVSSDVDFISGDLNPYNSFCSARYAGRAIAQQNKTWDLMSWNFRCEENSKSDKHPIQILQEAAGVISLGGGFQNYIPQLRDGSPRIEEIRDMKAIEEFVRPRQPYCFRGKAIHQAALLLSTYDRLRESSSLYSRNGCEKIMGMTSLICDTSHSLEIVSEHTLKNHCADYPVIIIPETYEGLGNETINELLSYAENGGNLLISGNNTIRLFEKCGLYKSVKKNKEEEGTFTLNGKSFGYVKDYSVFEGENIKNIALVGENQRCCNNSLAGIFTYGKGKIGVVSFDIGLTYHEKSQYLHRHIVSAMLDDFYTPIAKVTDCEGTIELTDLNKDGKLMIQLVNANGSHKDPTTATDDKLLPCRDIELELNPGFVPDKITLQPEGREMKYYIAENGKIKLTVDKVAIHEILVIE